MMLATRRSGLQKTLAISAVLSVATCCHAPAADSFPTTDAAAKPLTEVLSPQALRQKAQLKALREQHEIAVARVELAMQEPALGGYPEFERHRASIVSRVKSEPVYFARSPKQQTGGPKILDVIRERFNTGSFAWRALDKLRSDFRSNKTGLRYMLLRDGYLVHDRPNNAFALASLIRLQDLFDEPTLWLHRGERVLIARRTKSGEYVHASGKNEGQRLRLLHLDRVGVGESPPPALHRDFRALRYRMFFEQARVEHVSEKWVVADLRYQNQWVRTLLRSDGAKLSVDTEIIPPPRASKIRKAKAETEQLFRASQLLGRAMLAHVVDRLPFDEPKTEEGQQDGKLRPLWIEAYLAGRSSYQFNEDKYRVFSWQGVPKVPQVCIDFIVDTFERAAGHWWKDRTNEGRYRPETRADWGDVRYDTLRRTKSFLSLVENMPESFDVLRIPDEEQIEMGYKPQFFAWLAQHQRDFRRGDIVYIRGFTPWDEEEEHTHSFFVYETDPISGIPVTVASNPGPAQLWSWEVEARRTPERKVKVRIRPRAAWMSQFLDLNAKTPLTPLPLVAPL